MNQQQKEAIEQVMKECGARDIGDECWEWDGDTVEFVGRVYQHALSHAEGEAGWLDPATNPPPVNEPVLVTDGENVGHCRRGWNGVYEVVASNDPVPASQVSAWMPVPKPGKPNPAPQVAAPEIVAIALESARTSLAAYGNHPIIEGRINKALQALAQAGVVTDLVTALHYLLEQTVDQDLAHGLELTEGEMDARQQAIRAIERAGGVS